MPRCRASGRVWIAVARLRRVVYTRCMTSKIKERPLPLGARVYKVHRKIITKWAKKDSVKGAAIVRNALEVYDRYRGQ